MEFTSDLSAIRWLQPSHGNALYDGPLRVRHLLPKEYQQYLALLPAVGILEDFPFEQVQLDKATIQQINRNAEIWTRYGIYSSNREPDYQPTTFHQLAAKFGLPYDLSLVSQLPWSKKGFATLAELTAAHLLELLCQLASTTKLNLYVEDYWHWGPQAEQVLPTDDEVVYRVTAQEFVTCFTQMYLDATLYLFPDDLSWCLANAEDALAPVLGIDEPAATTIAERCRLEVLLLSQESAVF